jgi:hypothetical protein
MDAGRQRPHHVNTVNENVDAVTSGVKGISPDRTRNSASGAVRCANNNELANLVVAVLNDLETNY